MTYIQISLDLKSHKGVVGVVGFSKTLVLPNQCFIDAASSKQQFSLYLGGTLIGSRAGSFCSSVFIGDAEGALKDAE